MKSWRIVVVDDESLMAGALKLFLELADDLKVVGIASNGLQAVSLCKQLRPDVVLMDLQMPVLDGVSATRRITAEHPQIKVVVVTTFASPEAVVPALRAGASGYLLKDSRPEEVVAAVHDVIQGRSPMSPKITGALIETIRHGDPPSPPLIAPTLSARDREVLDRLAQGLGNTDMARELHITESAVKSRIAQLMSKFEVASRVQVLIRACELGLVRPHLRSRTGEASAPD
ncbi:MAG: response regulator transcription factor [Micrococcales bacterium]|nr:response regulator transcription factor [Micrococcales bacterium]